MTKEYPTDWQPGQEAYYPVNNEKNQALYAKYANLAENEQNVIFGGRLAEYKYYDMDDVIKNALVMAELILWKGYTNDRWYILYRWKFN